MRCSWLWCLLVPAVLAAPVEEEDENPEGTKWAVLVAGSSGWWNYRHQADICHAYQIMHRHGIPDSNIIVFMYDDIASNPENPNPGVIINRPNGTNVYGPKQVNKDYTGNLVTSQNFFNALTGNPEAAKSGLKVLKSGPNDHVFVYYADHGGANMIGFPDNVMYADELVKALQTMYNQKMYKKLLFYLESCEAGSMFDLKLFTTMNIIATTASNPTEGAAATYCDTALNTCLGDEYSVAWMEDTDKHEGKILQRETIAKQFKDVIAKTPSSHPQMYGDTDLKKEFVKAYYGTNKRGVSFSSEPTCSTSKVSVPSRETYLHYLNSKIEKAKEEDQLKENHEKKAAYIQGREMIDDLMDDIMSGAEASDDEMNTHTSLSLEQMPCYKTLVENFRQQCVEITENTYAMGHMYKFANLCLRYNFSPDDVLDIFSEQCTEEHRQLTGIY